MPPLGIHRQRFETLNGEDAAKIEARLHHLRAETTKAQTALEAAIENALAAESAYFEAVHAKLVAERAPDKLQKDVWGRIRRLADKQSSRAIRLSASKITEAGPWRLQPWW